jgi:HSF-type DNA-binding
MDDRRFNSSPSLCRGGRDSSSNTATEASSPLSLFRSQQQPELELQEEQDQQQNHVHQRLLSLLATRNRQQQPQPLPQPRPQQQPQPPLSAEELLKNILHRRRAGGETTTTTLNSLTMERTRAAVASASAADPHHIPLPSKLFSILGNKNFEHIVSWLPQGRAWRIHNVDLFAQRILPMFVNNNNNNNIINNMGQQQPPLFSVNKNLRVFTQQLESWGFCELSRGPNSLAYYSEVCHSHSLSQTVHSSLYAHMVFLKMISLYVNWESTSGNQ